MIKTMEITNSEDIIDSRNIIDRIEYLEDTEDEGEKEELRLLKEFEEEVSSSEWTDGITLIRDSYFEDYAHDFAEEIGAISSDVNWPSDCIDWKEATRELRVDYSCVDFEGVDYWYR